MHLSPLFDHDPVIPNSCANGAHRAALGRGLTVMAAFACLMLLAVAPRFFRGPSVASTITEYAAWDATNQPLAR